MKAIIKKIRVKKEDSAFVTFILESYEGLASFSTLPGNKEANHRDLELIYSSDAVEEIDRLMVRLKEVVYELGHE